MTDRRVANATAFVTVLLLMGSCRCPDGTRPEVPDLSVPALVDFGNCVPSSSVRRTATISNRSKLTLDVKVLVVGPFRAESPTSFKLENGSAYSLELTFSPSSVGANEGRLVVRVDDFEWASELAGNGIPECATSDSCVQAAFDPTLQRCVRASLSNGSPCTSRCLTSGTCVDGTCFGESMTCSDGDACTVDACDEVGSCFHLPRTCPVMGECRVARCDSTLGECVSSDLSDGTPCGPVDCAIAKVCIGGVCSERARPGVDPTNDCRYVDLSLSAVAACGVTQSGVVRCWGSGDLLSKAGESSSALEYRAPAVVFDGGRGFERVTVGTGICAWGPDAGRCTGSPLLVPDVMPGLAGARSIDTAGEGCIVDREGRLTCYDSLLYPNGLLMFDGGVVEARGSTNSGSARLADGGLVGWGGGLGPANQPEVVEGPADTISMPRLGLVIGSSGDLWATKNSPRRYELVVDAGIRDATVWGSSVCVVEDGQTRCLPSQPLPWKNAVKLVGTLWNLCALLDGGTIECLGTNQWGLLGSRDFYLPPTLLLDGGVASKVAVGDELTLVQEASGLRVVRRASDTVFPNLSGVVASDFAIGGSDLAILSPSGAGRRLVFSPARQVGEMVEWSELPWSISAARRVSAWGLTAESPILSSRAAVLSETGDLQVFSLGLVSDQPLLVRPFGAATRLALNGGKVCGLRDDGGVDCTSIAALDAGVERVPLPGPATALAVNDRESCAIVTGEVWCWTANSTPAPEATAPSPARALALGLDHKCVVFGTNGVACSGSNLRGALGHRGPSQRAEWSPVAIGEGVVDVTSGPTASSTCVRTQTSRILCWGNNQTGQLGREPLMLSPVPVPIAE